MMKVTVRADSVEIEGYVNAVGRDSRTLTDEYGYPFVEQIQPGTFGRALSAAKAENREIRMLLDHDDNHQIGGTDSNLELEEDSIGLHALTVVTDAETVRAAREQRLKGWSFGFRGLDYDESYTEGKSHRKITELELVEVSVIDDRMTPAYAGTSIHARAEGEEEKIYTRAFEDDEITYTEIKEEPKQEQENRSMDDQKQDPVPAAPAEPVQEPDYSVYRNRIKLLELG